MRKAKRRALLCLLLTLLLSLALCACGASPRDGADLTVYFFSAGKADAILLTTDSAAVLIDCGEKGFGQTILDRLAEQGVTEIDTLIITHFDQDHVGGAARVINRIPVKSVLQSDCPRDSEEYEKYLKALKSAGIEAVTLREEYSFTLDGVRFTVDPPLLTDYKKDDSNNSSLIVTVSTGAYTLLFTGDAQTERLAEYLAASPADCDLIKLPHHGGEEPLTDALLAATTPSYAVITCSAEEPDISAVLDSLERAGVPIWRTDEGPVLVLCRGDELSVTYETSQQEQNENGCF